MDKVKDIMKTSSDCSRFSDEITSSGRHSGGHRQETVDCWLQMELIIACLFEYALYLVMFKLMRTLLIIN